MHIIDWDKWGKLKNENKEIKYNTVTIDGTLWNRWTFELADSLVKRRFKWVPTYVTLEIVKDTNGYLWLRSLDLSVEDMTVEERTYLANCDEDMIDDLYYSEAI